MNKKLLSLALILILFSVACGTTPEEPVAIPTPTEVHIEHLTITYIGVEGVLITKGETKVLIDAVHDYEIPEEIQEDLINGVPPFDQIDLLLVTHNHSDHFEASLVGEFLINNPAVKMISTSQTVDDLFTGYSESESFVDRVEAHNPLEGEILTANLNGIAIEVFHIPHGINFPIENNGYLIDIDGVRVFHSGDAAGFPADYLVEYGLAEKEIDIYLFSWQYLAGNSFSMEDADRVLNGKYYFPLHGPTAGIVKSLSAYENVVFFENVLDEWVYED